MIGLDGEPCELLHQDAALIAANFRWIPLAFFFPFLFFLSLLYERQRKCQGDFYFKQAAVTSIKQKCLKELLMLYSHVIKQNESHFGLNNLGETH